MTEEVLHEGAKKVERDRPSNHGAILGEAISAIMDEGRKVDPTIPDCCLTCAFKPGVMTNQMATTGLEAYKCAIGVDDAPFGCHHGLSEGMPTRLCAGYAAARLAPFDAVKRISAEMAERIKDLPEHDHIRADFDAWWQAVDPDRKMDNYQLARAYSRLSHPIKANGGSHG